MACHQQTVVSVQGFNFSGSSAVMDILRECDNTELYYSQSAFRGRDEAQFKDSLEKNSQGEMQFFEYLSLKTIYDAILSSNKTKINLSIRQTILRAYQLTSSSFNNRTKWRYLNQKVNLFILKNLLKNFFLKIIKLTKKDIEIIESFGENFFFPVSISNFRLETFNIKPSFFSLIDINKIKTLSFVKNGYVFYELNENLTALSYCKYVNEFLITLFNNLSNGKDILVLDQFLLKKSFSDFPSTFFSENLKIISVYRDARDIFIYYQNLRERDVFKEQSVLTFCKTYRSFDILNKYSNNSRQLLIKFEDLLYHYDEQIELIFNFLKISRIHHVNKHKFFNPNDKRDTVGMYKRFDDYEAIKMISNCLPEWCINN